MKSAAELREYYDAHHAEIEKAATELLQQDSRDDVLKRARQTWQRMRDGTLNLFSSREPIQKLEHHLR